MIGLPEHVLPPTVEGGDGGARVDGRGGGGALGRREGSEGHTGSTMRTVQRKRSEEGR